LANEAHTDPLLYRQKLLQHYPRYLALLELAGNNIGWGKPLAKGQGLGIAIIKSFGTIVAQAAQVSVSEQGNLTVECICAAVDPGEVINPEIARAQIEGGIIFGLTAALYGKISIQDGRVQQQNFPDYQMLKLASTPEIKVSFIESGIGIGGIGEVGLPPVAPAVCNAIFAATGRRVRELPLINQDLSISS
jgi:isoquinoline 1-oxidoreductase beta subunit